jgi:hypothetical protein
LKNYNLKWIKLKTWIKEGIEYINKNCKGKLQKKWRIQSYRNIINKMERFENEDDI